MKRVRAACIMQTLVFQQKEGSGYSAEYCLELNREEVKKYKQSLERAHTRHKIDEETELSDGSIISILLNLRFPVPLYTVYHKKSVLYSDACLHPAQRSIELTVREQF